jgi:molecular chaperone DnaJ
MESGLKVAIITSKRDYYEVLGIPKDADQKTIKGAFRALAMKYHPDRNKEPDAEARFKEIAEAYAILSDSKKRADYDTQGFAGVGDVSQQDIFSGINFDDIFGGLNFGFGMGNPFESFFHRTRSGPSHGANVEVDLYVTLERVASGGDESIQLSHPVSCEACHGVGSKDGVAPKACTSCGGSGHIAQSRREKNEHVLIQQITICPVCKGRGNIIETPCPECHGTGQTEKAETLTVKIPCGIEEGMALRIPGKGMPSPEAGGLSGDLYVVVRTQRDPRFVRDGADLVRMETISLLDAVLGTSLKVPTLDGSASVTVPPGTQPGAVLRLKEKGLPEFGSKRHGVMYLRIEVKVPEKLTSEERELYERLRDVGSKRKFWK